MLKDALLVPAFLRIWAIIDLRNSPSLQADSGWQIEITKVAEAI